MSDSPTRPATCAVQLTPPGRGAVATVLVAGPRAVACAAALFTPHAGRPLEHDAPGTIRYGRWGGPEGEEVVLVLPGPERVEIHCHGGQAAPEALLESLSRAGCQVRTWQEYLAVSGTSAIQFEALEALAAPTERTARILLDQYQGSLEQACSELHACLAAGQLVAARTLAAALVERSRLGRHLIQPWKVVLAGPPNVGKSSLINALVGYQRAIVHDAPGTTRDVVTAVTALDGWPVELADTAGLRATADPLETAGVALAEERLEAADAIVLVFDRRAPWDNAARQLAARWPQAIVVLNKSDLAPADCPVPSAAICTSAATGQGLAELQQAMVARLVPAEPGAGLAVPFTPRQIACLQDVVAVLDRSDGPAAGEHLERLIGASGR